MWAVFGRGVGGGVWGRVFCGESAERGEGGLEEVAIVNRWYLISERRGL